MSRIEAEHLKFQGRVIRVNVEQVRLPNNQLAELEIIHHPGGAAVVAIDAQQRICLLHQFRHAANGWVWELPAGKIDHQEPHFNTAQRELLEEAGCTANDWQYLGSTLSSPGVFTEVIHLYLARQLSHQANQPEEHEVFQVQWLSVPEVQQMITDGSIRDAKTLVGWLLAQPHLLTQRPAI